MLDSKNIMISGHTDLSEELFNRYYTQEILRKLDEGYNFVIGCAEGADRHAFNLLYRLAPDRFKLFDKRDWKLTGVPEWIPADFKNVSTGYISYSHRDAAMTYESVDDICFVYDTKYALGSGTATNVVRRYYNCDPEAVSKFVAFARDDNTKKEDILLNYPFLNKFIMVNTL